MRIVADASAVAALVFGEKDAAALADRLEGQPVHAPELLKYELASIALKKARREPERAPEFFARLAESMATWEVTWHQVDPVDAAVLARATGLSAYDASYLWLAGWLEADLVTLDKRLASCLRE